MIKQRLNSIIFGTETKAGKLFDIVLSWIIVLSVMSIMLESVNEVGRKYAPIFSVSEWAFTALFTVEYLLRLWVSHRPRKYAFSFFGIVDLLALLPTYLTLISSGGSYLMVIRIIRLVRIFRVLKLGRYLKEASLLADALSASHRKVLVFLGGVSTLVIIMGTLMYLTEEGESGFTSIPMGIYWAIVTVTTVGYGDIVPQTMLGQAFAAILMLMGYAIIAVPTGIVTSELTEAKRKKKANDPERKCDLCNFRGHDRDAVFCKRCGNEL